jgi:hypothetical protein
LNELRTQRHPILLHRHCQVIQSQPAAGS